MNGDSKRLLDDVLEQTAPAEFRAILWRETLHHVRRRRQVRALNRGVLLLVLLTTPLLLWKLFVFAPPPTQLHAHEPEPRGYDLIRSQPFDPALIVRTQPAAVPTVTSSPENVTVVTTRPGEHLFRELTDEQLLVLLSDRPAALVRRSAHEAELVFANPLELNDPSVPLRALPEA